jgi:hypothetical protein
LPDEDFFSKLLGVLKVDGSRQPQLVQILCGPLYAQTGTTSDSPFCKKRLCSLVRTKKDITANAYPHGSRPDTRIEPRHAALPCNNEMRDVHVRHVAAIKMHSGTRQQRHTWWQREMLQRQSGRIQIKGDWEWQTLNHKIGGFNAKGDWGARHHRKPEQSC